MSTTAMSAEDAAKVREAIRLCIANPDKSYEIPISQGINGLTSIFGEFGFEKDDESLETNGWEVDFWCKWRSEYKTIQLSGSMYYGDFRIRLYEE